MTYSLIELSSAVEQLPRTISCNLLPLICLFFTHRLIEFQTLLAVPRNNFTQADDLCQMLFEFKRMQHEFPFLKGLLSKTSQTSQCRIAFAVRVIEQ